MVVQMGQLSRGLTKRLSQPLAGGVQCEKTRGDYLVGLVISPKKVFSVSRPIKALTLQHLCPSAQRH
uniref:Uncharacterized protein n=1 Tax=Anguilla anguilla TaxID=7936 RepID=A0A0E9W977_ANGAN